MDGGACSTFWVFPTLQEYLASYPSGLQFGEGWLVEMKELTRGEGARMGAYSIKLPQERTRHACVPL